MNEIKVLIQTSGLTFMKSKGWMVGKNKMKDWKAAVRTWEKDTEEVKEEYHVKTSRI